MKAFQSAQMLLRLFTLAAIVYLAGIFGGRLLNRRTASTESREEAGARQAFLNTYGGKDLRILQFYARDGELVEGRSTVICYGVLNAASVRIDPPVDGVAPALNRCVEIAPLHDTRYTLTAQDAAGHSESASFVLNVVPDRETEPRILSFAIANRGVDSGRPFFKLAFRVENAETVKVDPPVIPTLHRAPMGEFVVQPARATTYTLTATGKHGHKAVKQLRVAVDSPR